MRQAKCIINITVCFCETMGENISVSEHTVNTIVAFHYYFYEGRTESHEQLFFFSCELGTADEGECGGR